MVLLLLVPVLPAVVTGLFGPDLTQSSPAGVRDGLVVSMSDVAGWETPPLWGDARGERAFAARHVPGAINLNEDAWEAGLLALLERWTPGQRIVVYCAAEGCDASRAAALRLREELGTSDVFALEGGWDAWQEAQR